MQNTASVKLVQGILDAVANCALNTDVAYSGGPGCPMPGATTGENPLNALAPPQEM
jgi:hypothetical protein